MDKPIELIARAMNVLRDEGLTVLAKRSVERFFYSTHEMYVMKYDLSKLDYENDLPKVDLELCRVILLLKKSHFLSNTYHMPHLLNFNRRLNYGCIAILVFYKHSLATIGWSCPTLESSKADRLWYELAVHYADYTNGSNVGGGQWTDPGLRGLGFGRYGVLQRARYSYYIGKKVTYGLCEVDNKPALAMQLKTGAEIIDKIKVIRTPLSIKWGKL